jgi:hypothetical protein
MSDLQNPAGYGGLNETMKEYLGAASPWLRFIGVLSFIGFGFTALGGVFMLILTPFMDDIPGLGEMGGLFMGIFYLVSAALIFFPARFIYSFGSRLRNYFLSNSPKELELAFKNNKSIWKFYGVFSIVILALIPIAIVLTIWAYTQGFLDF